MSDADKPFIAYRRGRWSTKVVPRNAAGWRAILMWLLALAPIVGLFIWYVGKHPGGQAFWVAQALYLLAMIGWGVALYRWTIARAEIVDLDERMAIKRDRDRNRRR